MSLSQQLLAGSIQSRDIYELVRTSGEGDKLPDLLLPIWEEVGKYYERDPDARRVDATMLEDATVRRERKPKLQEALSRLLRSLVDLEVSHGNVTHLLHGRARERIGAELAQHLAMRKSEEDVARLIEEYQSVGNRFVDSDETMDWAGVLARRVSREGGLVCTPRVLNEILGGGLLPGHNLTLFGRPESGKTAVAISLACGFARRGHKVLYVGNEDPVEDLAVRALCNLTGMTAQEAGATPDEAQRRAIEKGANNLLFRDIHPGTLLELERMVRRIKPAVLVVDQLRNLSGGKQADNYVQLLDKLAQGIRAIGKKYGIVTISVTQAGDSARGKPVLDDGDIDSSNTGIPGAADVLIGVGVTDTLEGAGLRMLSVCKNKLTGRHGHLEVRLDAARSKVTSA